jgi:hypothetical protein
MRDLVNLEVRRRNMIANCSALGVTELGSLAAISIICSTNYRKVSSFGN